jgi:hypothetical protein
MRRPRYPWVMFGFTCLCIAAYVGFSLDRLLSASSLGDGFPVVPLGVLLGGGVGALILSRQPRNRIGWLLGLGGAGGALGFALSAYGFRVLVDHALGPDSAGRLAIWASQFFGASYAIGVTCAVFLLVPDGRLPTRRWRPALWLLVASYVLWAGTLLIGVRPRQAELDRLHTGPVADALLDISTLMLLLAVVAAAIALVLRLRRSAGVQRQQLRWIMASGVLLAVGVVGFVAYQLLGGQGQPWYAMLPLFLGYASLPICTGIAILRYRLYDIDVIINRAVVLAALTAFVTIGYVAVVVAAGLALDTPVVGRFWPSLAALVLIALAFQPLRLRVQRFADRLVYGQRAAPYEALSEFSRRLGRSPAPSELLPPLAEAVAGSVGASRALVALDVPGTPGLSATWPAGWPSDDVPVSDVELEVRDGEETLGRIAVAMPPGRGLRPAERGLLEDFAAQAGLAFRNLRLDAELRAHVEQLARQSTELAASRRRLLAARDDEQRRIARVIERDVLSHLRPIPAAVSSVDAADVEAAERGLERLEAATSAGLDALREVTRGVYPVMLPRQGLVAAVRSYCDRRGRAGVLEVAPGLAQRRFGARVEAGAYFCSTALLDAPVARLALSIEDGWLVLRATGVSEVDPDTTIVDRVEAAGGQVSGGRDPEGLASVRVAFPVPPDQVLETDAQTAASRSVPNADLAM